MALGCAPHTGGLPAGPERPPDEGAGGLQGWRGRDRRHFTLSKLPVVRGASGAPGAEALKEQPSVAGGLPSWTQEPRRSRVGLGWWVESRLEWCPSRSIYGTEARGRDSAGWSVAVLSSSCVRQSAPRSPATPGPRALSFLDLQGFHFSSCGARQGPQISFACVPQACVSQEAAEKQSGRKHWREKGFREGAGSAVLEPTSPGCARSCRVQGGPAAAAAPDSKAGARLLQGARSTHGFCGVQRPRRRCPSPAHTGGEG